MAGPFAINMTEGAEADLKWFKAYGRSIILAWLESHLQYQPMLAMRRLNTMRPNPVAGWELRLGDFRVLYDVDEVKRVVTDHVVGEKQGNRLLVRGQEFTTHESD